MKFLIQKHFDFSKLDELEHRYLNHVVYLDYLYSKKKWDDEDDDTTFDLSMDWSHIIMEIDTEMSCEENGWEDTELEKKFDLWEGLEVISYLRNSKKEKCWEMYLLLYDTYCVHPNDFDVKEVMTMFGVVFHLMNKEMERESLTAIG